MTLTGVINVVQALSAMGITGDDLKEAVSWFVNRFGTDYTDAQRQSLVANGISYASQLAQLDVDIATAEAALHPKE